MRQFNAHVIAALDSTSGLTIDIIGFRHQPVGLGHTARADHRSARVLRRQTEVTIRLGFPAGDAATASEQLEAWAVLLAAARLGPPTPHQLAQAGRDESGCLLRFDRIEGLEHDGERATARAQVLYEWEPAAQPESDARRIERVRSTIMHFVPPTRGQVVWSVAGVPDETSPPPFTLRGRPLPLDVGREAIALRALLVDVAPDEVDVRLRYEPTPVSVEQPAEDQPSAQALLAGMAAAGDYVAGSTAPPPPLVWAGTLAALGKEVEAFTDGTLAVVAAERVVRLEAELAPGSTLGQLMLSPERTQGRDALVALWSRAA